MRRPWWDRWKWSLRLRMSWGILRGEPIMFRICTDAEYITSHYPGHTFHVDCHYTNPDVKIPGLEGWVSADEEQMFQEMWRGQTHGR